MNRNRSNRFVRLSLRLISVWPVWLAAAALAAHFLRSDLYGPMLAVALAPFILIIPRKWALLVAQTLLATGAIMWVNILVVLVEWRRAFDLPWARLAAIIGAVALVTAALALWLNRSVIRRRYREKSQPAAASFAAFWLTALLLTVVQLKVTPPMLLAERFWAGSGWIVILVLSIYAAWVTELMLDPRRSAKWRGRIWGLFSLIFFLQLAIGLAGIDSFLMSGDLHLPIPAMIAGGPVFRGGGLFMLVLFGATVLLVGPAWCSYLCYVGAWDNALAKTRRRPNKRSGRWQPWLRVVTLIVIVGGAFLLRSLGASPILAASLGLAFGLIGVALMMLWSRRTGTMAHCSWYCPIGLLATVFGRLSPHRLRLKDTCIDCGRCTSFCRYDALSTRDIKSRRPGRSCTLCGDCLASCKGGSIEYRLLGLSGATARAVFITLVVSLHAVFLGVARI